MKERRASGATHSFRLNMQAAAIVDNISYPRSLGGKSKRVSQAIIWFFTTPVESKKISSMPIAGTIGVPTAKVLLDRNEELQERVEWWVKRCDEIQRQHDEEKAQKSLRTRVWRVFMARIGR